MTIFESILLLAVTASVIITAFGVLAIKKMLEEIIDKQGNFDNVVSQLYDIKIEVCQTNGRIDGFIPWAKHLRQKADNLENTWACDITSIIGLLKEIENDMNEHGIAQAKWFDFIGKRLTTIANHTNETTNKVAELVDFEKRNEQRNDEMFARCEEINKLQLAELKLKTKAHHTDDVEPFPPKDVVGATSTGICQECNGKNVCKYFDVNRNRCFVVDR